LRFEVNDEQLPIMGRTAMGLQALRLRQQEEMVGGVTFGVEENLLLVTQLGYAKRFPIKSLRLANRGDIGTQTLKFASKTDYLAGMVLAKPGTEVALVTNHQRVLRLPVDTVPNLSRDSVGENLLQLNRDEKIITVAEV
jgi:DNA gyrase subunit A